MKSRDEVATLTKEYNSKNKLETLWELYKQSIEDKIVYQAKRGKTYALIFQDDVNYLSNTEFKKYAVQQLNWSGYVVTEESNNKIYIKWD